MRIRLCGWFRVVSCSRRRVILFRRFFVSRWLCPARLARPQGSRVNAPRLSVVACSCFRAALALGVEGLVPLCPRISNLRLLGAALEWFGSLGAGVFPGWHTRLLDLCALQASAPRAR